MLAAVPPPISPTVIVVPSGQYLVASTYCDDAVSFDAIVITKPGDLPAEMDALDDLIDQVRSTLRSPSAAGHRYGFREVSGRITYAAGERDFPAVVVTVAIERVAP